MTDDEQPSRAELARRVEQLEQTVQRMLPSRRQALKIGGASLAGAAAFSAGNASAGSQQTGTIGSAGNPVDVVAEDIYGPGGQGSNDSVSFESVEAVSATIDNKLDWQEDPNSPFTATNTTSKQFTLANTYDQFKIVPRRKNKGFNGLRLAGVSSSDYVYIDNADQRTSGATEFPIRETAALEEIVVTSNTAQGRFGVSVKPAIEGQNNTLYGDLASPFPPTDKFTLLDTNSTNRSVEIEVYGVKF